MIKSTVAVMSTLAMTMTMMLGCTNVHAAENLETKEVVEKLNDNNKYTSVFAQDSIFGRNFGITLEDDKDFEYKVYFTDGSYSILNPSNCEAIKIFKELVEAGKVLDFPKPIIFSCNNKEKLIGIVYASTEGDNPAY